MALGKFPEKSQQEIADHVGCSVGYVCGVKRDVFTGENATRKDSKGRNQPTSKPRKPKEEPQADTDAGPVTAKSWLRSARMRSGSTPPHRGVHFLWSISTSAMSNTTIKLS